MLLRLLSTVQAATGKARGRVLGVGMSTDLYLRSIALVRVRLSSGRNALVLALRGGSGCHRRLVSVVVLLDNRRVRAAALLEIRNFLRSSIRLA